VAEPLHWVTVALVVSPFGTHAMVLPVADPMHWSTVIFAVEVPTTMLLVTVTSQITLLPPPLTMPLHWLTEVTRWFDFVTVVTGTGLSGQSEVTPAAAKHA
jgi:hypothetical protein